MEEDLILKKGVLTLGGAVRLPEGFEMPCRVSHSTAGPGAGFGSAAFSFGRFRGKKTISYTDGEFELHCSDGRLSMTRRGEPFLDEVRIEPIVRHCPQQAFFTIDPRCMFRCAYCNSPLLDKAAASHTSASRIMEMLDESVATLDVRAVSLTSGVVGSVDETVDRFVEVVGMVRAKYPDMPIGVEPYVSTREHIERLRSAGADEIKLNLEAPRRDIFERVCPDLDFDGIWSLLGTAVEVFGRGKVISNIIYGMGETDADIEEAMERLCSMGVLPGLRALRINPMNAGRMHDAVGDLPEVTVERAVRLARMQKAAMERHGLTTMTSRTMCFECGCCDLVPFRDL